MQEYYIGLELGMSHGLHNFLYRLYKVDAARNFTFILDRG